MKKTLPFFACLCMLLSLTSKAQEFTHKVVAGGAPTATGASSLGTQNNLTVDVNVGAVATADGAYAHFTLNSTARFIKISSTTNDIKKISIHYRGTGSANAAGLRLKYYNNSSLTTQIGTATDDLTFGSGETYPAPGKLVEFTVPDGVRYIEITYNTANTSRIYYLAAGYSAYTLPVGFLPLELLSFSAKPDALGKTVNLNWKTTNEVNTQDFVVERKADDTDFSPVTTVLSKNVAGTHDYSFTDKSPLAGNSYYRLKQRDKDGKHSYSEIVHVKIEGISLSLRPNPASHELIVNHDNAKNAAVLKVISLDGRSLIKANANSGTASTTINVAALAAGTYLLVYEANGQSQSQKFIKK